MVAVAAADPVSNRDELAVMHGMQFGARGSAYCGYAAAAEAGDAYPGS